MPDRAACDGIRSSPGFVWWCEREALMAFRCDQSFPPEAERNQLAEKSVEHDAKPSRGVWDAETVADFWVYLLRYLWKVTKIMLKLWGCGFELVQNSRTEKRKRWHATQPSASWCEAFLHFYKCVMVQIYNSKCCVYAGLLSV